MNKISLDLLRKVFGILLLSNILLAGCNTAPTNSDPPYKTVSNPSFNVGDAIPAPTGDVILTVTGEITNKNSGDADVFDMATLEKLGLVKYEVNDPWLNAKNTYTGILVSELLRFVGAAPSASIITVAALDDYQMDINISDIQKWPILLATQTNGNYMAIDSNGPSRIIFPHDTYSDIDPVAYKDLWVWSVKAIEIR